MIDLTIVCAKDVEKMFPDTLCAKCHNAMKIDEHRVLCDFGTFIPKNYRWRKHKKECFAYESTEDAYNRFLRTMCL